MPLLFHLFRICDQYGNVATKTLPGGGISTHTYDNLDNRLTNIVSADPNKTGTPEVVREEQYQYDELSRLTNVDYGDGESQSYTFDAMGNRLTKQDNITGAVNYTYNNANMLETAGADTYNSDPDGNTLSGGGRTNTWDTENRLTECVYNGHTSAFTYGSDGLRRSSTVDGTRTDYVLDGQNVVREMRNGTNYATYLIGPRGPEYRRDDTTGAYKYYVYDGLGSVVCEVDDSGNYTSPRAYDVYGFVRSGDSGSSSQKFCGSLGHASEDNTGLIYMRARYMDPALGRFVNEDPGRNGTNWYSYCGGNPLTRVDRTGRDAEDADQAFMKEDEEICQEIGGIGAGMSAAMIQSLLQMLVLQLVETWVSDTLMEAGWAVGGVLGMIAGMELADDISSLIEVAAVIQSAYSEGRDLSKEVSLYNARLDLWYAETERWAEEA